LHFLFLKEERISEENQDSIRDSFAFVLISAKISIKLNINAIFNTYNYCKSNIILIFLVYLSFLLLIKLKLTLNVSQKIYIFAVEITFSNNKYQKLANDYKKCQKVLGQTRAKLFIKRLLDLMNAETLEDVRNLPGRYHELKENRKGQWACDLDQPYRLVFEPHEKPIPVDAKGKYNWFEIKGIEILEIVDYH